MSFKSIAKELFDTLEIHEVEIGMYLRDPDTRCIIKIIAVDRRKHTVWGEVEKFGTPIRINDWCTWTIV